MHMAFRWRNFCNMQAFIRYINISNKVKSNYILKGLLLTQSQLHVGVRSHALCEFMSSYSNFETSVQFCMHDVIYVSWSLMFVMVLSTCTVFGDFMFVNEKPMTNVILLHIQKCTLNKFSCILCQVISAYRFMYLHCFIPNYSRSVLFMPYKHFSRHCPSG